MSRSPVRSLLISALAAGFALGVGSPAFAYIVVLKGGKRHIAIDKPVEREGHMTFVEKGSRAQYTVAIADVDQEKTKEANNAGAGDAYLLGTDGTTKVLKPPGSSRPSLNDRVQAAKRTPRAGAKATGVETPAGKKKVSKTPVPTPTRPPSP